MKVLSLFYIVCSFAIYSNCSTSKQLQSQDLTAPLAAYLQSRVIHSFEDIHNTTRIEHINHSDSTLPKPIYDYWYAKKEANILLGFDLEVDFAPNCDGSPLIFRPLKHCRSVSGSSEVPLNSLASYFNAASVLNDQGIRAFGIDTSHTLLFSKLMYISEYDLYWIQITTAFQFQSNQRWFWRREHYLKWNGTEFETDDTFCKGMPTFENSATPCAYWDNKLFRNRVSENKQNGGN